MKNKTICILGKETELGNSIINALNFVPRHRIYSIESSKLNISSYDKLSKVLHYLKPSIIFNCIEEPFSYYVSNKTSLMETNVYGIKNLSTLCEELKIKLIYFSTCQIFDGFSTGSYIETDKPNPINAYGKTKLLGENYILLNKNNLVIRPGYIFHDNTVSNFKELLNERKVITIHNQEICPTHTNDLATATVALAMADYSGIFNICNQDGATLDCFIAAMLEAAGISDPPIDIVNSEINMGEKVPYNQLISTDKYEHHTKHRLRPWLDFIL